MALGPDGRALRWVERCGGPEATLDTRAVDDMGETTRSTRQLRSSRLAAAHRARVTPCRVARSSKDRDNGAEHRSRAQRSGGWTRSTADADQAVGGRQAYRAGPEQRNVRAAAFEQSSRQANRSKQRAYRQKEAVSNGELVELVASLVGHPMLLRSSRVVVTVELAWPVGAMDGLELNADA